MVWLSISCQNYQPVVHTDGVPLPRSVLPQRKEAKTRGLYQTEFHYPHGSSLLIHVE
jgi:hypothetical protein